MLTPIKIYTLFLLVLILTSCGFKPIYKTTENGVNVGTYNIEFQNDPTYLIKSKILEVYNSSSSLNLYTIHLSANQGSTPLITNTDGTVSKYKIEVVISFYVTKSDSKNKIYEDISRGFAEYLVQTSEIETDEKRKQAIEIATQEAVQMMSIKIQSNIVDSQ